MKMGSKMASGTNDDYAARDADSMRATLKPYGDIHRLGAYPWVAEREDYEEGVPREAVQEQRDTFEGPCGLMRRYWRVTGPDDVGLPRRSETELHLELLRRTLAAGSGSSTIGFSYREMAPFLGLEPGLPSDQRVGLALSRLTGVRVRFHGETALPAGDCIRLLAIFGLVETAGTFAEGDERFGTVQWNPSVLASLRFSAEGHRIGLSSAGKDKAKVPSLRSLILAFLTPEAEALPSPEAVAASG